MNNSNEPYAVSDCYCKIVSGRTEEATLANACNALVKRGTCEVVSVFPLPTIGLNGYVRFGILTRNLDPQR